jgi:hypothetical protein
MSTSSILSSMPSMSSLSSKRSSSGRDLVAPFESQLNDDASQAAQGEEDPESKTTSLEQRFKQLHSQPDDVNSLIPQRLRLRTKKSKICLECDEHVIKAEQKTQTTKFKVKQMARFFWVSNHLGQTSQSSRFAHLFLNQSFLIKTFQLH